jgi:purine-binding chemotaxis protein CheW
MELHRDCEDSVGKYLTFTIADEVYAVPIELVSESVQRTDITSVPRTPEHVLGVMNLRGMVIPVFDTRTRFGLPRIEEERRALTDMLKRREQEHRDWIRTLEAEAEEGRDITVQRDPHRCKFGKWYDSYIAEMTKAYEAGRGSVDNILFGILKDFDEPHREIHGVADVVENLLRNSKKDDAKATIQRTHNTVLTTMMSLFEKFYAAVDDQAKRDVIIILEREGVQFGIAVDALDATCDIEELHESGVETEMVTNIGLDGERTIQILNIDVFYGEAAQIGPS